MPRFTAAVPLSLVALAAAPPPALAAWTWPLRGEVITAYRNGDDPYAAGQHRGVDIAGAAGSRVVAAAAGVVRFAGTAGSSGLTVGVRTADGAYDLSYLHLGSLAVRRGAQVAAGRVLGTVGTSGVRSAERPHLHFGVRRAGTRHDYLDPLALLPPLGAPAPRPPAAVPVAAPAPVHPSPSPSPSPSPVPRRRPLPAPRRVREPGPARRPVRLPVSRRVPVTAPRDLPQAVPAARPRAVPVPRAGPGPARSPAPALPRPTALGEAPRAAPAPAEPAPRGPERSPEDGPDLGWAAACAGLLGAALLLAAGRADRDRRRPFRPRLAALLPALAGRGRRGASEARE
ncbi:MAG: peptidoglycan DD-metalloendopeptidase family protein [Thermoleophilaceae bacterium]|nr:peptidoglycan DD-metalloendopeptidase family protein [Thermoleophilaceae bacterium]